MIRSFILPLAFLASPVLAETPNVATDIAPVHALVAQVMNGVGLPDLILPPGASPHGYAMRPSEAAALARADLVIWVGHELTPWLEKPLASIAEQAVQVSLLDQDGTHILPRRDTVLFEADDHGEEAHEHEHDHGHDHDGASIDPHVWLDPQNAHTWLGLIADQLASLDPEQADTYRANATRAQAELTKHIADITARLASAKDTPFVVFHDAYQYFEARFDLTSAGAISISDASRPGPARIATLQHAVADQGITCALSEPQFNPGLIATVFAETDVHISQIDPVGATLIPGLDLYFDILLGMADGIAGCAK